MDVFQSIILSVVEGLTEFLPVSSTGHMILVSRLMNIAGDDFTKSFEIIIQLGAILSVFVIFRKRFSEGAAFYKKLFAAFLPSVIAGLLMYKTIKVLLGNPYIVVFSLILGGIMIIMFEKYYSQKGTRTKSIGELSIRESVIIGLFQTVSMIPGVSRAAATIFGGMAMGLDRKSAVEFSFLLAVPTMIAATVLDLSKEGVGFSPGEWFMLTIGFFGAFATAWIAVKFLVGYVKRNNFTLFGVYRIVLGVVYWFVVLR